MSSNPNIQNSFGPEVTAHEHLPQSAPEANHTNDPLYFVSYNERAGKAAASQNLPAAGTPGANTPAEAKTPRRRILGLTVPIFWTVAAIIILAVLGVAVGLGVGLGLKKSSDASSANSSPSTTPTTEEPANNTDDPDTTPTTDATPSETPSSTSSAPVTSGTVGLSDNSCTFVSPKTYNSDNGTPFLQFCFTDWPNGGDADDGSGKIKDLQRLTLYTFEDCMEACTDYNDVIDQDSTKCMAVTYNSNLTSIIAEGKQGGNCFLKDKKGANRSGRKESASAAIAL